ncbi:MAG: hypothetical protein ISS15_06890 [Alphaproteobacteria bacterium]|nr:hypothetical protein [Alphaproteobacteria bacterium]
MSGQIQDIGVLRWRSRAQKMRAIAASIDDTEARAAILGLAVAYERMVQDLGGQAPQRNAVPLQGSAGK